MGQAKRRGTFDQRAAAAMGRIAAEDARRDREAAEREAAMTPAERRARHDSRLRMAAIRAAVDSFYPIWKALGETPEMDLLKQMAKGQL